MWAPWGRAILVYSSPMKSRKRLARDTYSIHLPHMPNLYTAFVLEQFLAPCFIDLLMFFCQMYWMFYVNDKPEGKFLYTWTIKLYCICLWCQQCRLLGTKWQHNDCVFVTSVVRFNKQDQKLDQKQPRRYILIPSYKQGPWPLFFLNSPLTSGASGLKSEHPLCMCMVYSESIQVNFVYR